MLQSLWREQGTQEAAAFLSSQSTLSERFEIRELGSADPDCIEETTIGIERDGTCLVLGEKHVTPLWSSRLKPLMLPVLAGLTVSVISALLLARRFVVPIGIIGSGLSDLAHGRLDRRIALDLSGSDRAFLRVGKLFDEAATQLETLYRNRDRLFHDISHEIRSPLARLQAAIGLLRKSPGRVEAMTDRMEGDIRRMDSLVDEILTLARINQVQAQDLQIEELDLVDIIALIVSDANFEGASRNVTCRYAGVDEMKVNGSLELLHRALENITRNALRYTKPGTEVLIRGIRLKDFHEVTVEDDGPGVATSELSRLSEPFYRAEDQQNTAGTGLGLAIAVQAIRAHGGSLTAENRQEGGLRVVVALPITRFVP